jgi:tetratricopeptide (TPR) repeat protein
MRDNFTMRSLLPTMIWGGVMAAVLAAAAPASAADQPDPVYRRAGQAIHRGDYDAAIRQLDEAIRSAPKDAKLHGLRGVAWLRKGDYARGAADLKAAIELNPGDAGAQFRPSSTAALSAEALRHGQEQVARMLRDRPTMAQYPQETEFLRGWAARKFAGEDFAAPIDWDPSPPLHSDAEHLAPAGDAHAAILVEENYSSGPKEGNPRAFEELWAGAVYELYNVTYSREFVRLNDEADEGKVSKEAFVGGILKYELLAAQRTRAFYLQVFLPWAEQKKLPTDPALWFCDWWDAAENVLRNFTDKSEYPWRPYGRTYDWAAVHRRWRGGEFEKVQKLLQEMQAEEGYEEEEADVSYWIGRCLARLNKPAEAVAAFSEALRLAPDNAPAYRARGEQYQKLGEKDKAEADLAKAKGLEKQE